MVWCLSNLIIGNISLASLVVTIIGLIVLWILVSIPVWLAGKAVTRGLATFGEAMLATLFGPIVYAVTLITVGYLLGALIGQAAYTIALVFALLAWIWIYRASFSTGWLRALAIAILAWIIFFIVSIIFGALLRVAVPGTFFPNI